MGEEEEWKEGRGSGREGAAVYLSDGAPHTVNEVLKVHEVEERLLLQLVQLLGESVLLVLEDGPCGGGNSGRDHGIKALCRQAA